MLSTVIEISNEAPLKGWTSSAHAARKQRLSRSQDELRPIHVACRQRACFHSSGVSPWLETGKGTCFRSAGRGPLTRWLIMGRRALLLGSDQRCKCCFRLGLVTGDILWLGRDTKKPRRLAEGPVVRVCRGIPQSTRPSSFGVSLYAFANLPNIRYD